MATCEDVFKIAMVIMDNMTTQGVISDTETAEYKVKTPSILTIGQMEIAKKQGITIPGIITSLTQSLAIKDEYALTMLPYFLVAHLAIEENSDLAAFCNDSYEEMKNRVGTATVKIKDVYNVLTGMV